VQPRYSPVNQALHWITALCMFAILPLAWVMTNAKDGTFAEGLFNWHKTLGVIVLLVTLFRIVWRLIDPPLAGQLGAPRQGAGEHSLWLVLLRPVVDAPDRLSDQRLWRPPYSGVQSDPDAATLAQRQAAGGFLR
jgi:Prokaryotic cytochrome b561